MAFFLEYSRFHRLLWLQSVVLVESMLFSGRYYTANLHIMVCTVNNQHVIYLHYTVTEHARSLSLRHISGDSISGDSHGKLIARSYAC